MISCNLFQSINILQRELRANFRNIKVARNQIHRISQNFAKNCILLCLLQFEYKKMGVTELVFESILFTKIGQFFDTMILAPIDIEWL